MLNLSKYIRIIHARRQLIAAVLAVIYLVISCSPLASIAMHSKTVLHAITGECTGDCITCGCSAEGKASNTCCCSKKRAQEAHKHENESANPDCCKKKPTSKKAVIASCGCPCGSEKVIILTSGSTNEILPYYFPKQICLSYSDTLYSNQFPHLISRHIEPLVPPPKQENHQLI